MDRSVLGTLWLGLALLIVAGDVRSEVYRCERGGVITYTDRPCADGAVPHELPPIGQVPAGEAADLSGAYDERRAREREQRTRENARWLQEHQARKAQAERFEAAIREGRVLKGMTPDHVRRALGRPDEVERGAGAEIWTYGTGRGRKTLVFRDGQLTR